MAELILTLIADNILEDDNENKHPSLVPHILLAQSVYREDHVRIQHYVEDVVANYSSEEFRRIFRLNKTTFHNLVEQLSTCPEMKIKSPETGGRAQITIQKSVLITLRYLGHQCPMKILSDTFNISESSVVSCRDRVISALLNNFKNKFIKWPVDNNDKLEVSESFQDKRGFPMVIGAIDGTHVPIKAPNKHPADYVNRKKFHSVVLQAVCLPDMKFSHCVAGWPGSCHDSRVLKNSNIWEDAQALCGDFHILGDGGYPLLPWLLTPYRDNGHLQAFQRNFNFVHASTRCTVERAFGLLKGRFRRLTYIDVQNVQCIVNKIMASCILHNFCISEGDVADVFVDAELAVNAEIANYPNQNGNQAARLKRDAIAQRLLQQ